MDHPGINPIPCPAQVRGRPSLGVAWHLSRIARRRRELARELAALPGGQTLMDLEIGCGHGHFLTAYADAHPDRFCLGVDRLGGRINRAERKRIRQNLENVRFIRAEAEDFFAALPPECRFARIFLLYNDPWPKAKHHKNRLLQQWLLERLVLHSGPGAEICFRTDHRPYHDWALLHVEENAHWAIIPEAPWPFEHTTIFAERAEGPAHSFIARRR